MEHPCEEFTEEFYERAIEVLRALVDALTKCFCAYTAKDAFASSYGSDRTRRLQAHCALQCSMICIFEPRPP